MPGHDHVGSEVAGDPRQAVAQHADWTEWISFAAAVVDAPQAPGVYLARLGPDGPIIYVGHAGPRDGGGAKRPEGLRGRLRRYSSGKAVTSGLGEAVADRAFGDPSFVQDRLDEIVAGSPRRAAAWGRVAFDWADLHICWATRADKASAKHLEDEVGAVLQDVGLWNRARFRAV